MIFNLKNLFHSNKNNSNDLKVKKISKSADTKINQDNSTHKITNNYYVNSLGESIELVPTTVTFDDGSTEEFFVAKKVNKEKQEA